MRMAAGLTTARIGGTLLVSVLLVAPPAEANANSTIIGTSRSDARAATGIAFTRGEGSNVVRHRPASELRTMHPTSAVDGEGRSLSVSLPFKVKLYGLLKADEIAAHAVLRPASAGAAELGLILDNPVQDPHTAGSYVGVLSMTLNYN